MRSLSLYIRQIFCSHEFSVEDKHVEESFTQGTKRYLYCPKCGYHNSHWKFL